ncbi:AfsR/SARP family transcriptional regulator [Kribbella sp. NPDC051620]|uniref:AfsR/SARP family transcriptional regulator n=1 Tax=Kribbella sp. NPDC051620 TaxID=3364120 RepID=UPI0037A71C64
MTAGLRIELLGSLSVRLDGQLVEVGPLRQQALLAVLALRANRTCTPEELFDAVWGDRPPATGLKVLPPYIYRIRKALPVDGLLERTRDGYMLRLAPDAVDVNRFDAAVQAAEAQQDAGAYAEALNLFRGEPLSGLPGHYLATHRQRLVERRYKVLSDRIDLDLASGRHSAVVAELVTAVAERPLDERLAGQLMLALYAGGRQADAMNVYTQTRHTLVEQLGVEPGPELRATHQRILRNEGGAQPRRDELPYQDSAFVGRDDELAAVVDALSQVDRTAPPIVTVDGMGGAGKTALAVRAARELAGVYPDGLLYLQLHGHTPGRGALAVRAALDHLLSSIGMKPERIPRELDEQAALWRSEVAGRRVLIVLDDTPDSRLVAPLLPGAPSCGVLITSRRQLIGIDAARRVPLGVLGAEDAARLLVEIVGSERGGPQEAAQELVERCGYLPLAIRIAGARLRHRPTWTVEHLNQRLQAQDRGLDELTADGRGLVSTFAMSYEQLSPEQQRMFRYLSLLPGRDVDRYGAAALAGVEPHEAEPLLEDLLDASLLLQSAPDRFQFHDLLRQYAGKLSQQDAVADREAAVARLLEYYLQTAHRAVSLLTKVRYVTLGERPPVAGPELTTPEEGRGWGDAEGGNVVAAVQRAADGSFDEQSWMIAAGFARYFHERNLVHQRTTLLELGLAAAERLGASVPQARVLFVKAVLERPQQGPLLTLGPVRAALELLGDDDPLLRTQLLSLLGQTLRQIDPGQEAVAAHTAALELAQAIGDRPAAAHAMTERAITEGARGEHRKALESYRLALSMARADGDRTLQPHLLNGIAESYNELGQPLLAIEAVKESRAVADELGMRFSRTDSLCQLGAAHRQLGDYAQAIELQQQALAIGLEAGNVYATDEARTQLGRSHLAAGQLEESKRYFEALVESAQEDHRRLIAARGLDGLAACAEAAGGLSDAATLIDAALERLGPMTPRHAEKLRHRRKALPRTA